MLSKCSFWMQGSWYLIVMLIFHLWYYLQWEHWFRYQIPDEWPYQEARRLFKEPTVLTEDDELNLKWSAPDEEVITILFDNFKYPFKCSRICILTDICLLYIYIEFVGKITRSHYVAFLTGVNNISGKWERVQQW